MRENLKKIKDYRSEYGKLFSELRSFQTKEASLIKQSVNLQNKEIKSEQEKENVENKLADIDYQISVISENISSTLQQANTVADELSGHKQIEVENKAAFAAIAGIGGFNNLTKGESKSGKILNEIDDLLSKFLSLKEDYLESRKSVIRKTENAIERNRIIKKVGRFVGQAIGTVANFAISVASIGLNLAATAAIGVLKGTTIAAGKAVNFAKNNIKISRSIGKFKGIGHSVPISAVSYGGNSQRPLCVADFTLNTDNSGMKTSQLHFDPSEKSTDAFRSLFTKSKREVFEGSKIFPHKSINLMKGKNFHHHDTFVFDKEGFVSKFHDTFQLGKKKINVSGDNANRFFRDNSTGFAPSKMATSNIRNLFSNHETNNPGKNFLNTKLASNQNIEGIINSHQQDRLSNDINLFDKETQDIKSYSGLGFNYMEKQKEPINPRGNFIRSVIEGDAAVQNDINKLKNNIYGLPNKNHKNDYAYKIRDEYSSRDSNFKLEELRNKVRSGKLRSYSNLSHYSQYSNLDDQINNYKNGY